VSNDSGNEPQSNALPRTTLRYLLRLHAARGSRGPFWQHQFWDRFVRHEREFQERLDYMHLNPVRKGLVKRPENWRWSSYNNFALDQATVAACPYK